jgi:hypothetical protein
VREQSAICSVPDIKKYFFRADGAKPVLEPVPVSWEPFTACGPDHRDGLPSLFAAGRGTLVREALDPEATDQRCRKVDRSGGRRPGAVDGSNDSAIGLIR